MSVVPMITPGGAPCWALSCAGAAASSPASAIAATVKYSLLFMVMVAFLVVVMTAPVAIGRSGDGRESLARVLRPLSSHSPCASATASRRNVGSAVFLGRAGLGGTQRPRPRYQRSMDPGDGTEKEYANVRLQPRIYRIAAGRGRRRAGLCSLRRIDHPRLPGRQRPERGGVPAAGHRARLRARRRVRQ